MDKIQVKVLNPDVIAESEKIMVCAARLTQGGHKIKSLDDFMELYNKSYKESTATIMSQLPHPTIQKFGVINVVVVGASRRFLMQITRHQNEVKFMSASCQYSDYRNDADFVVPYDLLDETNPLREVNYHEYINSCADGMARYNQLICDGVDHDEAAYVLPQSLRNVLIISATPYQWVHMIKQRICRRNTLETRYVMLKIWEELSKYNPLLFGTNCIPDCAFGRCKELKFSCGNKYTMLDRPKGILERDFSNITRRQQDDTGKVQ